MCWDSRAHVHTRGIKHDSNIKAMVSVILYGPALSPRPMVACHVGMYQKLKNGNFFVSLYSKAITIYRKKKKNGNLDNGTLLNKRQS